MFAIIYLLAGFIADLFKSPCRLELENLFLRHQLNIALRRASRRVPLRAGDRALMVWMTRWPSLLGFSRDGSEGVGGAWKMPITEETFDARFGQW